MHICSFQALPEAAGTPVTVKSRYQTYQKVDPGPDDENGAAGRGWRRCARLRGERKHTN